MWIPIVVLCFLFGWWVVDGAENDRKIDELEDEVKRLKQ